MNAIFPETDPELWKRGVKNIFLTYSRKIKVIPKRHAKC